ncbi:hypothetical protein BDD43_4098 [Mucilaginibacter gracilis]|uniref:Uncharacterized protein n=1 Tax=Mucilaginibacter gracilis TaxID=423350 RepID=A0A495J555_9SPHI|nr:hypothetical protein [Mucilaginibacter gracilis]RKR83883.1 hypothetical protein BDD43_4098 [Mucilaginibacter gracilis]
MKYIVPKLKSFISALVHPRTLALRNEGLTDEELSKDHNTWFI